MPPFWPRKFEAVPDLELEETRYEHSTELSENETRMQPRHVNDMERSKVSTETLQNHRPSTTYHHIIQKNRRFLWAAVPLFAAIIWTTMMSYFYIYYVTLPRMNGMWPRIGLSYATFPFISCVGAVRLSSFQGFCIVVSALNVTAFILNLYVMRQIRVGRFWRWAKAIASCIGSVFLILLSFYSVDSNNRLHLIFTSMQIVFTGLARSLDGVETNLLLRCSPSNPYINRSNMVKKAAAIVAGPSSLLAVIGIYGCRDALVVLRPGTTCHILVEIAAPAEWILAGTWTLYLVAISMELYYTEVVREDLLLQIEKSKTVADKYEAQSLLNSSMM